MKLPSNVTLKDFREKLYNYDSTHGNLFMVLSGTSEDELVNELLSSLENNETVISYVNNGGSVLHLVSESMSNLLFLSEVKKAVAFLKESSIFKICDIIRVCGYTCSLDVAIYSSILNIENDSKILLYGGSS